jgi:hypothetical protein
MQHSHTVTTSAYRLVSQLDELSAGCDPEFDATYEELDREFAEIRLQLGNQ